MIKSKAGQMRHNQNATKPKLLLDILKTAPSNSMAQFKILWTTENCFRQTNPSHQVLEFSISQNCSTKLLLTSDL